MDKNLDPPKNGTPIIGNVCIMMYIYGVDGRVILE
jgi:hypothetical protein